MLDADAAVFTEWNGDLKRLSMRAWSEDCDLAAMVVVKPCGDAAGWINLRTVRPDQMMMVWLWIRHAAHFRPPADVLYAEDLAGLLADGDRRAEEA